MDNIYLKLLMPIIVSFALSSIITGLLIPYFKKKQFGQYIREEGPKAHLSKAGIPTMGGIAIMISIIVTILIFSLHNTNALVIIVPMLAYGVIGIRDDYAKIAKKQNEGLTPAQKITTQIIASVALAMFIMQREGSEIIIPFAKSNITLGFWFVPFIVFVQIAMANAVNLTDGLDGLASINVAIVSLGFAIIAILKSGINAPSLIPAISVLGATLGFLVFNHFPAKIFMGDTGSMALGGVLSSIAIVGHAELVLPIAGLLFVLEALSVIIQVLYFKKTGGKRFFRMAPLHHHFELSGFSETKVVTLFSIFTLVTTILGVISIV